MKDLRKDPEGLHNTTIFHNPIKLRNPTIPHNPIKHHNPKITLHNPNTILQISHIRHPNNTFIIKRVNSTINLLSFVICSKNTLQRNKNNTAFLMILSIMKSKKIQMNYSFIIHNKKVYSLIGYNIYCLFWVLENINISYKIKSYFLLVERGYFKKW